MSTDGHWWTIDTGRWGVVVSDDLTLDEVERIENVTEVAWAVANPLASVRQAKAWLMVAAMHAGAPEDEAIALVTPGAPGALALGGIKGAFQLRTGDAPRLAVVGDESEVPPVPPTSAPTSAVG